MSSDTSATFDFTAIKRAGLTQSEFAAIVEVSRVTVNMWVNAAVRPHSLVAKRVSKLLGLLGDALQANLLPLPAGSHKGKEPRLKAIRSALRSAANYSASN